MLSATFSYDAVNRRATRRLGATTTEYSYDGLDVVQERAADGLIPYLNGLRVDERFIRGQSEFYLTDGLGSSVALADASGAVSTRYRYEAFGRSASEGSASSNAFQFTGRESDTDALQYFRARYYAPGLHRFLSEDPAAAVAANRYLYVQNNPVNAIDPLGLVTVVIHGSSGSFGGPSGSLAGGGNTGLNQIQSQLIAAGQPAFAFASGDKAAAIEFIKQIQLASPSEPIHVIGHSMGGDAAIDVAEGLLQDGIVIDSLIPIDPFAAQEREIDARLRTITFRQESGLPWGTVLSGSSVVEQVIKDLGPGGHFDITNLPGVRGQIIDIITGTPGSSLPDQPVELGGPPK